MNDFTTWDILRNLLLAARWTIVLSVVAFIGDGVLGPAPDVCPPPETCWVPGTDQ